MFCVRDPKLGRKKSTGTEPRVYELLLFPSLIDDVRICYEYRSVGQGFADDFL